MDQGQGLLAKPGDRIDIWEVERALGAGGMGSVYRCHNVQAPRILAAVKVLERSLRTSDDAMQRFVREAEILDRLDHPNVVRVRNVRMDHDPPFIEMDFVEGTSLEALIEGRALPLRRAFEYMEQLVDALVYIHAENVRHRDIKPANLLVTDEGRLKLVDFGLAVETDLSRITQAGMTFGTVSYAPPEWIDPANIDPVQWDLYASGVVFYEMVLGLPAFPSPGGGSPKQQAVHIMLLKQGAPPLDLGEPYPEELRELVRALTAVEPTFRPRSAVEVRARLASARDVLERRGWDITHGPMPSEVATEIPAVQRRAPTSSLLSMAPQGLPSRMLLGGLVGAVALASAAGVALALVEPLGPPPMRDIVVAVANVPEDYPLSLHIEGKPPLLRESAGWLFERVPVGARQLSWVAGQSCACDEDCPAWCGVGTVPIEVLEGKGALQLAVPLELPEPGVVITIPSIQDTKVGLFRRKPDYKVTATLDGRLGGVVDAYKVAWRTVVPGKRELVVTIGECAPEAIGCWPLGTCPAGCSSTVRQLVVPFGDDDVVLSLDLPVPK